MRFSRFFFVTLFVFAFGACGQASNSGTSTGGGTGTGSNAGTPTATPPAAGSMGPECQKIETELTTVCGDTSKLTDGEKKACDIEQKAFKAVQVLVKAAPDKAEENCKKTTGSWAEKGGLAEKVKSAGAAMDKAGIK